MWGILFTISDAYGNAPAAMDHIDGLPSREAAEKIALQWKGSCNAREVYIYEMDIQPSTEQSAYTVSKPAYDAQMDMRPKDLFNKLWDLRSAARLCKNCICDDPMQTATVIENITIADRLANELFDAFPEDTVEDETKDKDTEAE